MADLIEALPRAAKFFLDSGVADSVDEAVGILARYRMHIAIGEGQAGSPTHQATLLTALNCAGRCLLGGVTVSGSLHQPNLTLVGDGATLRDAVESLGGIVTDHVAAGVPVLVVGGGRIPVDGDGLKLRSTFDGWRSGVVPADCDAMLPERREFPLSGAMAGALAVSEVFAHLSGEILAGRRPVGVSLWDPGGDADWTSASADGPDPTTLPSEFWVIGLGHLGQAYLWALSLLPFGDPTRVRLMLQDVDKAGPSTPSTSVLTSAGDVGALKTRICRRWCEERGFDVRVTERRFDADLRVGSDEPGLALCGVDNPDARRALENVGFSLVFEAGLGSGTADFRMMRLHSFPAAATAAGTWPSAEAVAGDTSRIEAQPGYRDLATAGVLDPCGITRLAQVAVGAPFVGMVAAAMVVAQAVRTVEAGTRAEVVNLDLRAVAHRAAVMTTATDVVVFRTQPARLGTGA